MKINIQNLTKRFKKKVAVNNVTLELHPGITALLGVNGSGKTTLMRMIATVLEPSEGTITADGENIIKRGDNFRSVLGYLPQNFGYYKEFTAFDFMMYMAALKGIDGKAAKAKCDELLDFVSLSEVKKKKIKTFSGGMIQRLGIAQALINDPTVLILDEPTSGLDPKERIRFRKLLEKMSKDKIIIYSTHIVSDISHIADRVLLMQDGEIIEDTNVDMINDICVQYFGEESELYA